MFHVQKHLLLIVALVASGLTSVLASRAHCEIVQVKAPNSGGVWSVGQGVYIGRGVVLTAYHVIRGTIGKPIVIFRDGLTAKTIRMGRYEKHDLAGLIIELPAASDRTPSLLAPGRWPSGQVRSLRSVGTPLAGRLNEYNRPAFCFSGPSVQGDSGGPIWNDEGVVSIVCSTDGTNSYGPEPSSLRKFVQVFCGPNGCPPRSGPPAYEPEIGLTIPQAPSASPPAARPQEQAPAPAPVPLDIDGPLAPIDVDALAGKIASHLASQIRLPGPSAPKDIDALAGKIASQIRLPAIQINLPATSEPRPPAPKPATSEPRPPAPEPATSKLLDDRLKVLENAVFEVTIVGPDGVKRVGKVHPNGGRLEIDFSK